MESFVDALTQAWDHLSAPTALPTVQQFAAALAVGALLVLWRFSWRHVCKAVTVAHEGGHALAARLTRRSVLGVRIHADGSGFTHLQGTSGGRFGTALVSFAGYPFPGIAGALLIAGGTTGYARLVTAAVSMTLFVLLWSTRNLHGWLVVGLCLVATMTGAWYLPGAWVAMATAAAGSLLLAGSLRSLVDERTSRRRGSVGSDVYVLASVSRWPAGVWWTLMLVTVLGSAWLAWLQVSDSFGIGP